MIAVYVRVSAREQLEGYGIDVQKTHLLSFLKNQEIDLKEIEIFEDPGYSASSMNRPALKQLLSEVDKGNINIIYVYKLDRMFRNLRHQIELLEKFIRLNVRLICITKQIDYLSANGKLFSNIRGSVYQWERDSTSERTKDGLYQSALEGNYSKSAIPFGYTRDGKKIIPLEKEVKIVRRVFDLLEETQSSYETALAAKLEFPEYSKKIHRFHTVNMAKNKIYIGTLILGKNEFKNHSPAIISDEQILRVQQIDHSLRYTKHSYYFKNMIFDYDLKKFDGTSGTSHTGTIYYYYINKKVTLSEKKLFDLFIKIYKNRYQNLDRLKQDKKWRNALKRKRDIVIKLFVEGLITKENYVKTLQEINDSLATSISIRKPELSGKGSDREKTKFVKSILSKIIYDYQKKSTYIQI